jgi:hypothetical protein
MIAYSIMCGVWLMDESNDILMAFGQSARGLIELLYQDTPLNQAEQIFIEHHLALIRAALEGWQRRNAS